MTKSLVVALMVVAAGLAGCGGGDTPEADPNKSPAQVRQEAQDADAATLEGIVEEYQELLAEKQKEVAALLGEMKELTVGAAQEVKAKREALQNDINKLTELMAIYTSELAKKQQ
jgi:hypothetical protein